MGPGHLLDELYGLVIEIISKLLATEQPLRHILFSALQIAFNCSFGLRSEMILVFKKHVKRQIMRPRH